MKINRRDLLKYFGVGSAIVPIIGGAPAFEAEAKLIKPAEVEIPETPASSQIDNMLPVYPLRAKITVTFPNGARYDYESEDVKFECERIDITAIGDGFRRYIPGAIKMSATVHPAVVDAYLFNRYGL